MDDLRKYFLPYCLDRQPDGRYAVLNRRYKPVGLTTHDHVEYAAYPCLVAIPAMTPGLAQRISVDHSPEVARIYLHGGGGSPLATPQEWADYCERLALVLQLRVEPQPPS